MHSIAQAGKRFAKKNLCKYIARFTPHGSTVGGRLHSAPLRPWLCGTRSKAREEGPLREGD